MTSRDVRDIMSISEPAASPGIGLQAPPPRRAGQQREKRPDGITRELYALMGDNAPSLALAQSTKPKFKERIKRTGPAIHWQLSAFTNPSRGAGKPETEDKAAEARKKLKLSHWVRDLPANHVDGSPDAKFAKFNTSSQPYSYTEEEYTKWLSGAFRFARFDPPCSSLMLPYRRDMVQGGYRSPLRAGAPVRPSLHRHGRPLGAHAGTKCRRE
jgi:DNA methyltransferase 1-associated protein 1